MKKIIEVFFLCVIMFTSCVNKDISLEEKILLLDTSNENSDKKVVIIITSDIDCSSCYTKFEGYKESDDLVFKGYYSSKDQELFLEKLNKINSNIEWNPLDDYDIITEIQNKFMLNGPYEFILYNNAVTLRR